MPPTSSNDGFHAILTELARTNRAAERDKYEALFAQLAERAENLFRDFIRARVYSLTKSDAVGINIEDADDMLCDLLLTVFQKIQTYRGDNDYQAEAWLRKIISNQICDAARKLTRRRKFWTWLFGRLNDKLGMMSQKNATEEDA